MLSFPLVSASKFGIGSRTNTLGINNYYINQTVVNVANGSDIFVFRAGDNMSGPLNLTGSGVNILINQNTALPTASIAGTALSARGADNALIRIATSSYGIAGVGAYANRHARGTGASPTAVDRGDTLVSLEGWGYGASAYSSSSRVMVRGYAAQIWNDTNQPTYLSLWTSKNNTSVPLEQWRIDEDGTLYSGAGPSSTTSNNIVTQGYINASNITVAHKLTAKSVNITNNLYVSGNLSVKRPYLSLTDNTTQTLANTALAYPINFSHIEDAYLISLTDGKNISVLQTGDYLIEVSALFSTTTGSNKHVEIWLQKNNDPVLRSSTYIEIPTSGVDTVVTVPFIIDLNLTDHIVFMWNSDTTAAQIISYPNRTAPRRPEVPSIILTMSKISEITD